jgi:hypothetical protein
MAMANHDSTQENLSLTYPAPVGEITPFLYAESQVFGASGGFGDSMGRGGGNRLYGGGWHTSRDRCAFQPRRRPP